MLFYPMLLVGRLGIWRAKSCLETFGGSTLTWSDRWKIGTVGQLNKKLIVIHIVIVMLKRTYSWSANYGLACACVLDFGNMGLDHPVWNAVEHCKAAC